MEQWHQKTATVGQWFTKHILVPTNTHVTTGEEAVFYMWPTPRLHNVDQQDSRLRIITHNQWLEATT
jgi:hypothetical protein